MTNDCGFRKVWIAFDPFTGGSHFGNTRLSPDDPGYVEIFYGPRDEEAYITYKPYILSEIGGVNYGQ